MDVAYQADAWQALYTAIAGASAALTGLLFIGLSMNLPTISKVPAHKARAREALGGMLSLLILSTIMLIPGQGRSILGSELIGGFLILFINGLRLQYQTLRRMTAKERLPWILRVSVLNLGIVAGLIAGISLLIGRFGGLFWLVPTVLLYTIWSVNNAWLLVVQATEETL